MTFLRKILITLVLILIGNVTLFGQKSQLLPTTPLPQRNDTIGAIVINYYPIDYSLMPERITLNGRKMVVFTPLQEEQLLINQGYSEYYKGSLLEFVEANSKNIALIDTLLGNTEVLENYLLYGSKYLKNTQSGWVKGIELAEKFDKKNKNKNITIVLIGTGSFLVGTYCGIKIYQLIQTP